MTGIGGGSLAGALTWSRWEEFGDTEIALGRGSQEVVLCVLHRDKGKKISFRRVQGRD